MAQVAAQAIEKLRTLLTAPTGLPQGLAAVSLASGITLPEIGEQQVVAHNVAAEVVEKAAGARYPAYFLYCERLENTLREKFRQFSGTAQMAVEVRVTHDRLEGLDQRVQHYVDALTETLDQSRGDWGGGQFYTGGYQVVFGPVKHGGRNFVQTAKVTFDIQISK